MPFVSRAGLKLDHALAKFAIDVTGLVCTISAATPGGLRIACCGAGRPAFMRLTPATGMLDWRLRKDARVVVMERTNAMHAELPSGGAGGDRRRLDAAAAHPPRRPADARGGRGRRHPDQAALRGGEAGLLVRGVLPPEGEFEEVLTAVTADIEAAGFNLQGLVAADPGQQGERPELLRAHLRPTTNAEAMASVAASACAGR